METATLSMEKVVYWPMLSTLDLAFKEMHILMRQKPGVKVPLKVGEKKGKLTITRFKIGPDLERMRSYKFL